MTRESAEALYTRGPRSSLRKRWSSSHKPVLLPSYRTRLDTSSYGSHASSTCSLKEPVQVRSRRRRSSTAARHTCSMATRLRSEAADGHEVLRLQPVQGGPCGNASLLERLPACRLDGCLVVVAATGDTLPVRVVSSPKNCEVRLAAADRRNGKRVLGTPPLPSSIPIIAIPRRHHRVDGPSSARPSAQLRARRGAVRSDCGSGLPWRGNARGMMAAGDDDDYAGDVVDGLEATRAGPPPAVQPSHGRKPLDDRVNHGLEHSVGIRHANRSVHFAPRPSEPEAWPGQCTTIPRHRARSPSVGARVRPANPPASSAAADGHLHLSCRFRCGTPTASTYRRLCAPPSFVEANNEVAVDRATDAGPNIRRLYRRHTEPPATRHVTSISASAASPFATSPCGEETR